MNEDLTKEEEAALAAFSNGFAPSSPAAPPARPTPARPTPPVSETPARPVRSVAARPTPLSGEFATPVSAPGASSLGVRVSQAQGKALNINSLLQTMVESRGSDLHLSVGAPPLMRIDGDMTPIPDQDRLTEEPLKEALYKILKAHQKQEYESHLELDLSYVIEGLARFRVNLMRQKGVIGAVFRVIPTKIQPLESLNLPPVLYQFAALQRGLVLVTGPTGSGKSTTLASLIDKANRTRLGHIITIEDPIEFVHQHISCVVNQREVGSDTESFANALKHVLRQDPDIILIGELRDIETMSIAITAAETGHLVFATVHTQSAQDTVNRLIDAFPENQQGQIRSQLAATLKGVVCQTLVKRADGVGRIAAVEIMVVDTGIAQMIRKGETHMIPGALQSGGAKNMQTLNGHLARLVMEGTITRDDAEEVATDIKDLDAMISVAKPRVSKVDKSPNDWASGSL
jgi:twitching motility protein PilT